MVEHSKPLPDIYLKACELLGVKPENAIAIEDSPNGIRSAAAAGMLPVMVPDMVEPTPEIEGIALSQMRQSFCCQGIFWRICCDADSGAKAAVEKCGAAGASCARKLSRRPDRNGGGGRLLRRRGSFGRMRQEVWPYSSPWGYLP